MDLITSSSSITSTPLLGREWVQRNLLSKLTSDISPILAPQEVEDQLTSLQDVLDVLEEGTTVQVLKNGLRRRVRTVKQIVDGQVVESVVYGKVEQPCVVCDRVYLTKKFLQRHKTAKHHLCKPTQQLECEHCGSVFADVDSFAKHCKETESQIKEYVEKGLTQTVEQKQNAATHIKKRKLALREEQTAKQLRLELNNENDEKNNVDLV